MLERADLLAFALGILLIIMGFFRLTRDEMPLGLTGRLDDLLDPDGKKVVGIGYLVIGPLLAIAAILYWFDVVTLTMLLVSLGVAILLTAAVTFVGVFGSAGRNSDV